MMNISRCGDSLSLVSVSYCNISIIVIIDHAKLLKYMISTHDIFILLLSTFIRKIMTF